MNIKRLLHCGAQFDVEAMVVEPVCKHLLVKLINMCHVQNEVSLLVNLSARNVPPPEISV